jgi:hypothetical protein
MTKVRHIIGNIGYAPNDGPSWLVCDADGTRLDAPTPAELSRLWVAHGGKSDRASASIASRIRSVPASANRYDKHCLFDGCAKAPARKPYVLVPGYCMEHAYIVSGVTPKRRGIKPTVAA